LFGRPKKLKKIPSNLLPYIQIEGEAVKNANDKHMIVSYAYRKLDIINWYIELLNNGSKKYSVPHSLDFLNGIRQQLMDIIKKIMDTPIPKVDRPLMDIKYPEGYEG